VTKGRSLLLGTIAYAGITFPLAYAWHLVLFADLYERMRFVTVADPNVALGFFTILLQGILLALVFPAFRTRGGPVRDGLVFGLFAGLFLWSAAAVAHVAKHEVMDPGLFIGMEAIYFLVDFLAYGYLMGRLRARGEASRA